MVMGNGGNDRNAQYIYYIRKLMLKIQQFLCKTTSRALMKKHKNQIDT